MKQSTGHQITRKQLQELHKVAQEAEERSLIENWIRNIHSEVLSRASRGLKTYVVQHWQGGEPNASRTEKLLASLRQHFSEDIDIRMVDVPSSQPMLIMDWS